MSIKPLKLAIIGAGPSAFYVASRILSSVPHHHTPIRVHLYDRLWAPHGLVRYGVAPDHPEVKNCTHKFDVTATDPRFKFFGNINIGDPTTATSPSQQEQQHQNLPLTSLLPHYSHILFATGCPQPNLHPSLPPTHPYCTPAISLVHWYTHHPSRPTTPPPLDRTTHVSLIGNGNVSLDIARMLLMPVDVLREYDVPSHVLDVLSQSKVQHVSIIGRRGPLEAAFTTKELRELINLPDTSMVPLDPVLLKRFTSGESGVELTRQQSRIMQVLSKGSKNAFGSTRKTWSLDFYRSPTGLTLNNGVNADNTTPVNLELAHTTVDPQTQRAVPTGETSSLPTSLVVTSLGFHGESLTTTSPSPSSPLSTNTFFDKKLGHIPTLGSRVLTPTGQILRNVYASGWAATGAKGVLAATMINANFVGDTILSDVLPDREPEGSPSDVDFVDAQVSVGSGGVKLNMDPALDLDTIPQEVSEGVRKGVVTTYGDWKKVDEEEVRRGQVERSGKERERMGWEDASRFLLESGRS